MTSPASRRPTVPPVPFAAVTDTRVGSVESIVKVRVARPVLPSVSVCVTSMV